MNKLTPKQDRFCDEYLIDLNGTQAAIRAGYSKKTAQEASSRLLSKVIISEEIQRRKERLQKTGKILTPDQVLSGYSQDIEFDPRSLFDTDGNPIPIHKLPDEIALSLAGFEIDEVVVKSTDGGEQVLKRKYKYKLPDKKGNRDSLGKFHGLFIERIDHNIGGKTMAMVARILKQGGEKRDHE